MNIAQINARGTQPLATAFGRIAAMQEIRQLPGPVAELQTARIPALFGFRHSAPPYLATDAYNDYAQALFRLAGDPAAVAAREARAAIRIELGLRKAPRGEVQKFKLPQLRQLANAFDWRAYFAAAGSLHQVLRLGRGYLQALNGRLLTIPLADWKSYLRWRWLDATAPLLAAPFATAHFEFYHRGSVQPPRAQQCNEARDGFPSRAYAQVVIRRDDYFGDSLRLRRYQSSLMPIRMVRPGALVCPKFRN